MKRRTSLLPAVLLATLGSGLVLGLTVLAAFATLGLGGLRNVDCQGCHDLNGVFITSWAIGGVGLLLTVLIFWSIFTTMRPTRDKSR
jgi:amino acid transporter